MKPKEAALLAVIEDEVILLDAYQMLFEEWGFTVIAAVSADQALELLNRRGRRCPDAIIADYSLKNGQTGVDAIRRLEVAFGTSIPSILVTGETETQRLREAEASGVPVLHKPVNGGRLHHALTRCLTPV